MNNNFDVDAFVQCGAVCPNCGGAILGDGYTVVLHCEFAEDDLIVAAEPDAPAIYCYRDSVICPDCSGNGDTASGRICRTCKGSGEVIDE